MTITTPDGTKDLVSIDKFGGIYLNGDVYVNGQKLETALNAAKPATSSESSKTTADSNFMNSKWFLLSLFLLSVLTSVGIAAGIKRRQ